MHDNGDPVVIAGQRGASNAIPPVRTTQSTASLIRLCPMGLLPMHLQ
jgi:hypothetical protein